MKWQKKSLKIPHGVKLISKLNCNIEKGENQIMKKRILTIIIVAMMVLSLVGCSSKSVEKEGELDKTSLSMFVEIEETNDWTIIYHRETKVMYAVSQGSYNQGTFTVLVNADGSPMLYEE